MTGETSARREVAGGPAVELYARSSLPEAAAGRRDQVIGQLGRLAREGHVATATTHTWDRKVPVDGESLDSDRGATVAGPSD